MKLGAVWWYAIHGRRELERMERNWQSVLKVNRQLADLVVTLREALERIASGYDASSVKSDIARAALAASPPAARHENARADAEIENLRNCLHNAEERETTLREALELIDDRWMSGLDFEPLIARAALAASPPAEEPQPRT